MTPFQTYIAGVEHYKSKNVLPGLSENTPLHLVQEPENLYNSNAIAVYYQDSKLGHLPEIVLSRVLGPMGKGELIKVTLLRTRKEGRKWFADIYLSVSQ